ncbi:gliding motility-associated C-terminal domain-containing protein [Prevotella sp. OH937_COT-195]|uniref:gliding motility-associated C-terminal domain-containing protein n=1 Tax=Prevotella sp. OH937_COT-195 TaxID=2491051 RepID=UPI000F64C271|nr:gliding motility-associated C-terminal domain-containing protein [Prevotella sp. OH937_COT-195]RRC99140.1 gliding motility-associated C-terminal domain-containing protein [Prevotella sp. OH937_COT-195]
MKIYRLMAFCGIILCANILAFSQNETPTIEPTARFTNSNGEYEESNNYSGDAPLVAHFMANPKNQGEYSAHYEWRFVREGEKEPFLTRYEENTEYTFNHAGTHSVVCHVIFTKGNDRIEYTDEYWNETEPIKVTISESSLDMPNAFSPNGDGYNDIYKAKTYKSIIEFHAYIFNRWGQKLYEWDTPEGGWDGTFNGKDVKQGTYFVLVKATGSDGRKYNIRRDVNLLRGFVENSGITEN